MKRCFSGSWFKKITCGLFLACLLLSACKNAPPPPEKIPSASLAFTGVKADTPDKLCINFSLEIENPLPFDGEAVIESWQAEINGQNVILNPDTGLSLECPDSTFRIKAGVSSLFSLKLNMDMDVLAKKGYVPFDDYKLKLVLNLALSPGNRAGVTVPQAGFQVSGIAAFPGLRPPVFSITSIAILKAELINTRFRVGIKIDNPNPFPIDLSAFSYELYGNGRPWADGIEKDILKVNGKSSLGGNLFLIMNFIDMKRDLLDQVINLEDVNYRFSGEAMVTSGVEYLSQFRTSFSLSGYSQVLDN